MLNCAREREVSAAGIWNAQHGHIGWYAAASLQGTVVIVVIVVVYIAGAVLLTLARVLGGRESRIGPRWAFLCMHVLESFAWCILLLFSVSSEVLRRPVNVSPSREAVA